MIEFNLEGIESQQIINNFQQLQDFLREQSLLNSGFKMYRRVVEKADSAYRLYHDLGFRPTDILVTHVSNNSSVVINFEQTTSEFIQLNIPSANTTIHVLAGLYVEES